ARRGPDRGLPVRHGFRRHRSAARHAARRRFQVPDPTFDLVEPLVGPLGFPVGGFGALGRALHARVELVEARVDRCELVRVGGAAGKAHDGEDRHAERHVLPGQGHSITPSTWGHRRPCPAMRGWPVKAPESERPALGGALEGALVAARAPLLQGGYSMSRKLRSCSERLGCRSLRRALASIWRMRSRVTSNCLPTSSRVWSVFMSMPKRMRSTLASRGVSPASTSRTVSMRLVSVVASIGDITLVSSMKSPRCESSSSPIGVSMEI